MLFGGSIKISLYVDASYMQHFDPQKYFSYKGRVIYDEENVLTVGDRVDIILRNLKT